MRKQKDYPPNYLRELQDDVDDYIRYMHRQAVWRKQAKKFRRRVKVNFD